MMNAPRSRYFRRITLLATVAASLWLAPAAFADTASLSITDAAGNSDPVVGIGRTFTVTGNTPTAKVLYVKYRSVGGAACAPSPGSDSGRYLFDGEGPYNGNFVKSVVTTWREPAGTYLFCMWLTNGGSSEAATPISQQVTFRDPTGTISAAINPLSPLSNTSTTVTLSGASEGTEAVYAKIRTAGGAPCAASSSADSGSTVISGTSVNGNYSVSGTVSEPAGTYVVCSWLAESSSDPTPVAGPLATIFTVVAPPPPCVVPRISLGSSLADTTSALAAAHCGLGATRYAPSARAPSGTLVKLGTASGTKLPTGTPIAIVISTGRPCIVPQVTPGLRIARAKAMIRAANCTAGPVRHIRNRRAHGVVVRFNSPAGTKLDPKAKIAIIVSRGRPR
jgi:hypothetical protein